MRFLGLTLADDVPDSKTIWLFRERLTEVGLVEILFETFIKELEALNLIINEGKILDDSFVEVPIQRNRREENKQIKQGDVPQQWQSEPNKLAQKDVDAIRSDGQRKIMYPFMVIKIMQNVMKRVRL